MINKMEGSFYEGLLLSLNTELEVCKKAHPIDYKTVADWIDNELNV